MLAFKDGDTWVEWTGQQRPLLGDGSYQLHHSAEQAYSDEDLARYGLYRVVPVEIPAGKVVASTSLEDEGGVPVQVGVFADPPAPTSHEVGIERERRIELPLTIALPGVDPFQINMDVKAQRNIQALATKGMLLLMTSDPATESFRDYANQMHDLTGMELVQMGQQVAARIRACYESQWALTAQEPIPQNYADNEHWPDPEPT